MKNKRFHLSLSAKDRLRGYAFLAPWLIGLVMVFLVPLIQSIVYAFNQLEFRVGEGSAYGLRFVGWENFRTALLKDKDFPQYLVQTLSELLYNVPVILVFSFFVALLLKKRSRGTAIVKAIYFLPVILSSGIFLGLQNNFGQQSTSALEQTMQSASSSISVLKSMNLEKYLIEMNIPQEYITLLTGPIDRLYSLILSSGVQIFIFLAALNSISPSLYEAAEVEGATAWENFWYITFPMTMPMLLVNLIFTIIDSFTSVNNVVMEYVYDTAFTDLNFGLSSAMGWFYCLILFAVMGIAVGVISRRVFYYT